MILNTSWWLIRKPPQSEDIYPNLTSLWEFWYGWPKVSLATHQFQQFLNFKVAMADIFLIFHSKNGSPSRVSMLVLTWAMTYKGPQNINCTSSGSNVSKSSGAMVVPSFNLNTMVHKIHICNHETCMCMSFIPWMAMLLDLELPTHVGWCYPAIPTWLVPSLGSWSRLWPNPKIQTTSSDCWWVTEVPISEGIETYRNIILVIEPSAWLKFNHIYSICSLSLCIAVSRKCRESTFARWRRAALDKPPTADVSRSCVSELV